MRLLRRRQGVLATIRARITVALIALSTLATLIGATLATIVSTVTLTGELGQRYRLIAEEAHHVIAAHLDRTLADVQIITLDATLRDRHASAEEIRQRLLQFKDVLQIYEDITLLDLAGNIVTSTDYSFRGLPQHREYFWRALRGEYVISGAHAIPRPYKVVVNCAGPVRDDAGATVAVVVTQINMETLWQALGAIRFEKSGHAVLVDSRGLIIGTSLRDGLFAPCEEALLDQLGGDTPLIRYTAADATEMLAGAYPRRGGDARAAGLRPPESWTVVVLQQRREALAAVRTSVVYILLSAVGLSLMAVGVGFALSRRITRPLAELSDDVSAVAAGDLDHEVDTNPSGEVGILAVNVDRMRCELKDQIEKLSQTVVELEGVRRELEDRLAFESQLAEMSSLFIRVGEDDLDRCVMACLSWLAEILAADRAILLQFDQATDVMRITHRHLVGDLPTVWGVHDGVRLPWLTSELAAGRTVRLPASQVSPGAADEDLEVARELGVEALLALPLHAGERFLGGLVVAVHGSARSWPDELVPRLEIVTHVLANALERHRVEAALRRERALFLRGPVVVLRWQATTGWPVEYVSPNVEELLGVVAEEMTGGQIFFGKLIHAEDQARVLAEATAHAAAGEDFFEQEYRVVRADGELLWLQSFTVVVRDGGGAVSHFEGYAVDSTQRVEARRELERLNLELEDRVRARTLQLEAANELLKAEVAERQQAEATVRLGAEQLALANDELETFAYSVSHDLRTPLRAIGAFSQIVLDEESQGLSGTAQHALTRIHAASGRLAEMIDGLLQISRAARAELASTRVDLSAITTEVVEQLRATEPDRQVEFCVENRLTAHGDPRLLSVVVQNLIGNAWKFTGGRAQARIEFRRLTGAPAGDDRPQAAFVVRDNGVGFDMSYQAKLFTPFGRLHRSDEFPGTGIGLATVQRIIRKHGGQIWAESVPGEGAAFSFTLPAGRLDD